MTLINCEINLIRTWSENCVIAFRIAVNQTTFAKTDAKLYVPILTLSSEDNAKLLQQLKSAFKHIIIWKWYKPTIRDKIFSSTYRNKR